MSIATFSPAFTLLFAWALLWILMGIHYHTLSLSQKKYIPLLFLLLAVCNQLLRMKIGAPLYGKIILLTLHLPTFLVFRKLTGYSNCKILFMILSALTFTSPAVIIGGILQHHFSMSKTLVFLSDLAVYLSILLLAHFVFAKGFQYILKYGENRTILPLCCVPLLYYLYVFAVQNIDLSILQSKSGYFIRSLPTLYVFLFYFLLFSNYRDLSENHELKTMKAALTHNLHAAQEQLRLLAQAQTQTAVYQHDMRHHLNVIKAFLDTEKTEQASAYIQKVQEDVDVITPRRFCENEIVNLLCSSFARKAEQMDIALNIEAKLPDHIALSDTELCSILSNGLENAFHAVEMLGKSEKWVSLYCERKQNKFLLEIQNPYLGEISLQDGLPLSNQQGHGYGCRSIASIVERHRGLCSFEPKNGIFTFRLIVPESIKTKKR